MGVEEGGWPPGGPSSRSATGNSALYDPCVMSLGQTETT